MVVADCKQRYSDSKNYFIDSPFHLHFIDKESESQRRKIPRNFTDSKPHAQILLSNECQGMVILPIKDTPQAIPSYRVTWIMIIPLLDGGKSFALCALFKLESLIHCLLMVYAQ